MLMKLLKFKPRREHGGLRVTIPKKKLGLAKIDSLQLLKLDNRLREPYHTNKFGRVACLVIEGWMEAECDGSKYLLKKNQGILFEPGERHKITRGEGIMLSVSSEDYKAALGTVYR
ncbi:hypothetical protein HYS54_03460 [Candidatus Micrarchaeota archaeon]|nr:hypothetical protein [Candidatus Micrarchaeota archaeon]